MHQVRRNAEENLSFPHVLPYQAELQLPQVAQAPMNQAGGAGGSAMGKIFLLQKQCLKATEGCIPGNTCPDDAPTNHNQIESLLGKVAKVSLHATFSPLKL